jgi:hypothetical protein
VATAPIASFAEVELASSSEDASQAAAGGEGLILKMPSGVELHGLSYEQAQSLLTSLL